MIREHEGIWLVKNVKIQFQQIYGFSLDLGNLEFQEFCWALRELNRFIINLYK